MAKLDIPRGYRKVRGQLYAVSRNGHVLRLVSGRGTWQHRKLRPFSYAGGASSLGYVCLYDGEGNYKVFPVTELVSRTWRA